MVFHGHRCCWGSDLMAPKKELSVNEELSTLTVINHMRRLRRKPTTAVNPSFIVQLDQQHGFKISSSLPGPSASRRGGPFPLQHLHFPCRRSRGSCCSSSTLWRTGSTKSASRTFSSSGSSLPNCAHFSSYHLHQDCWFVPEPASAKTGDRQHDGWEPRDQAHNASRKINPRNASCSALLSSPVVIFTEEATKC